MRCHYFSIEDRIRLVRRAFVAPLASYFANDNVVASSPQDVSQGVRKSMWSAVVCAWPECRGRRVRSCSIVEAVSPSSCLPRPVVNIWSSANERMPTSFRKILRMVLLLGGHRCGGLFLGKKQSSKLPSEVRPAWE